MSSQIYHLTAYGLLQISGKDAAAFLQGQLSCDVTQANKQQALLGGYCNAQGRLLASFWLLQRENDYLCIMPRATIEPMREQLQRFAIFSQVALQNVSEQCALVIHENTQLADSFTLSGLENVTLALSTDTFPGIDAAWHSRIIQAGIPMIHPQTQEKFLPHRVNMQRLDGALSFDKGCYVGQEIIARLHYRGKLKHHMYRMHLQMDNAPQPGTAVKNTAAKTIGNIVDACRCSDTTEALIILPIEEADIKQLMIDEVMVETERLDLPYHF